MIISECRVAASFKYRENVGLEQFSSDFLSDTTDNSFGFGRTWTQIFHILHLLMVIRHWHVEK